MAKSLSADDKAAIAKFDAWVPSPNPQTPSPKPQTSKIPNPLS